MSPGSYREHSLRFPKLSKQISLVRSFWASLFFCKPVEVNLRRELARLSISHVPVPGEHIYFLFQAVALLLSSGSVERTTGRIITQGPPLAAI